MILLNTKSILDCDEEETKLHFKEIEDLFEKLSNDHQSYNIEVTYLDPYQKKHKPTKLVKMQMSELENFIQNFDIKNGADIYNDQKNIVIRLYGQTYQDKDEDCINTTQLYTRKEF